MSNFDKFLKWFASSKIASFFRVFAAVVLAQAVADFVQFGKFDFTNLEAWLIAACASTLPMLLRLLNPEDSLTL